MFIILIDLHPNKREALGICFIVKVKPWKHESRVVLVKTLVKILKNNHLKYAVMQCLISDFFFPSAKVIQ